MSHADKIRPSQRVRTYLFDFPMPSGEAGFVYIMCKATLETDLYLEVRKGNLPNYATVIACGPGKPDENLRYNMERYYGHIHERMAA